MANCCNYTLEKHLKAICEENYQYIDLFATWELDKKIYKSMLQGVGYNFPHYSMHEGSHSKSIISNIEMVLGEDRIKLLGATETWMLLESAYLHDFGMILQNAYVEKNWASDEFQQFIKELSCGTDRDLKEATEYILNLKDNLKNNKDKDWPVKVRRYVVEIISAYFRGKHAKMSRDYINEFNNKWGKDLTHGGLIKPRLFNLIGEVSFLHGQDFESVMKLPYVTNGLKSDYIHPRFIAEMIRLGDLLDLDNGRFNEELIEVFGKLPELSKDHLGKHGAIRHVLITPKRIDVSSDCKNDNEWRETRKWFDWLRSEIEKLTINWENIVPENFTDCAPQIGELTILKDGKEIDRKLGDLKLNISREKTFEILEGAGIYESKLDFLRELIQNALDASKIQMWRDLKSGIYDPWIGEDRAKNLKALTPFDIDEKIYENYKIIVEIEYTEDEKIKIVVKDKGIGIDDRNLLNMANVGESWDKRKGFKNELKEIPSWLKPTGGFGIGLQSCFMVCNEININTKTSAEVKGRKIKIQSGREQGFITSQECDDISFNRGSEVIVETPLKLKTTYNVGGYAYKKLKEYDFFKDKDKDEFDFWIILEYIENVLQNPLFEIEVQYKDSKIPYENFVENHDNIFNSEEVSCMDENYIYTKHNDNHCLWDKTRSSLIIIKLLDILNNSQFNNTKFYFKGVQVKNESRRISSRPSMIIDCDIHGMNVTDVLTLDRKCIKKESEDIVKEIINDAVKFVLNKYKANGESSLTLNVLYDIYKIDNKFSKEFKDSIAILRKTKGNEWDEDKGDLGEILNVGKDILVVDSGCLENFNGYQVERRDLKTILNVSSITLDYDYIIIDKRFIEILEMFYRLNEIKNVSYNNENIRLCIYSFDNVEPNLTVKVDKFYRDTLLKDLISNKSKRTAINAFGGYKYLSINKLEYFFRNEFRSVGNTCFIISPLNKDDGDKINNGISKEAVKQDLKNRQDFKNLVDYVFENRAEGNPATKEQIINSYMDLIDEYYDVVKSEPENIEEIKSEA